MYFSQVYGGKKKLHVDPLNILLLVLWKWKKTAIMDIWAYCLFVYNFWN
jgi:hypothetical protein